MTEPQEPPFVNFMIIGVQKGGTTALSHFLAAHPAICMATGKELHVFDDASFPGVTSTAAVNAIYRDAIDNFRGEKMVGEATPAYLWLNHVSRDLARYNPALRLIVLLRNPRDRTLSHYRMEVARGKEKLPLWAALLAEPWRLWCDRANRSRWAPSRYHSYLARSRYAQQLKMLFRSFPRHQVLIIKTEDLLLAHEATLNQVFEFLGVDKIAESIPAERHFSGSVGDPPDPVSRCLLAGFIRAERRRLARIVSIDTSDWC